MSGNVKADFSMVILMDKTGKPVKDHKVILTDNDGHFLTHQGGVTVVIGEEDFAFFADRSGAESVLIRDTGGHFWVVYSIYTAVYGNESLIEIGPVSRAEPDQGKGAEEALETPIQGEVPQVVEGTRVPTTTTTEGPEGHKVVSTIVTGPVVNGSGACGTDSPHKARRTIRIHLGSNGDAALALTLVKGVLDIPEYSVYFWDDHGGGTTNVGHDRLPTHNRKDLLDLGFSFVGG